MKRGCKVRWRYLTMSNDTQPEIRFPGFTEDWEQRKLKYIFKYRQGQQVPVENQYFESGENRQKFIRIVDLTQKNEVPRYIEYFGENIIQKDDLFMIRYGQPGIVGYGYNGVIANNLFRLIPKISINNLFFYFILQGMFPMISKLSSSTTMPALSFNSLDLLEVKFPSSLIEQQKIGTFFKQLDDTIALQQRKLDLLKETKKGFLQKMFPKNGAKVPEIRFPGFTENWEEKKFKEVINSGIKGKAKAEMSGTKSLYLDTNYLNGGVVTYVDSPRDVENDDVLILWDGSQAGTVYYGFSGALGSTLKAYRAKESGAFLYQQLKRNQQIIYDRYRTPNIPHVVKTFTDEFMVSMPSSEEQQKIGAFFKQLDDTIALHQRKLDLLKETKKGFLQKMFV